MKRQKDDLEDIERCLAGLTPGQWQVRLDDLGGSTLYACVYKDDTDEGLVLAVDTGCEDSSAAETTQEYTNASFVASSPTLVRYLLDEVKRLKYEREEFLSELYKTKTKLRETLAQAASLSSALADSYDKGKS